MSTTVERMETLEKQVRTLKRMLFGVFGLVLVGGLLAATTLHSVPNVIKAKRFTVVNNDGNAVANLGTSGGSAGLEIINNNGKGIIILGADEKGAGLVGIANGNHEAPVVALAVDRDGAGVIGIGSKGGISIPTLGIGDPHVRSYEDGLKSVVLLNVNKGSGAISTLNDDGKPVAVFGMTPNGGALGIFNKDVERVVVIAVDEDGDGVIKTSNNKGEVTSTNP